jgi:hypothetical protein
LRKIQIRIMNCQTEFEMKVEFAGLKTLVPDGWVDESTLLFQSQNEDLQPDAEKASGPSKKGARLAIRWVPDDAPQGGQERATTLAALLQERLSHLPRLIPDFALQEEGGWEEGADDEVAFGIYELEMPRRLTHQIFVRRVQGHLVTLSGASTPEEFEQHRPIFEAAAKSLVLAPEA